MECSEAGRIGGQSRSPAKIAASRETVRKAQAARKAKAAERRAARRAKVAEALAAWYEAKRRGMGVIITPKGEQGYGEQ